MFESVFLNRGLSLDRLKTMVEVHHSGSIASVAEGDPTRASLYSRQLKELSEFFGSELTERKGRTISLTREGIFLAQLSYEFFLQIEDFLAECQNDNVEYSICAGDSLVQWLIMPRIAAIVDSVPKVRLNTESLSTRGIVEKVTNDPTVLGLVRETAPIPGLRHSTLGRLSYCLVVPHSLLAGKSKPTPADIFENYPIALQLSTGEYTTTLMTIATQLAPTFRPALGCQSLTQVLAAVRSRRFAAVLPEISLPDLPSNIFLVVPSEELATLQRDIRLVWNPRMASIRPHAIELIEACTRTFKL